MILFLCEKVFDSTNWLEQCHDSDFSWLFFLYLKMITFNTNWCSKLEGCELASNKQPVLEFWVFSLLNYNVIFIHKHQFWFPEFFFLLKFHVSPYFQFRHLIPTLLATPIIFAPTKTSVDIFISLLYTGICTLGWMSAGRLWTLL